MATTGRPRPRQNSAQLQRPPATPSGRPASRASPVTVLAILLGLIIRNTIGVPTAYEHGLRLCIKTVLRIGIVLLGLKLTILAIAEIGKIGIPIIIVCISTALIAVTFINRALGLPKRLGTLIAVGTSICGVSAIVATAPVIEAEDDETSYAVACITLFGLVALHQFNFASQTHERFSHRLLARRELIANGPVSVRKRIQ